MFGWDKWIEAINMVISKIKKCILLIFTKYARFHNPIDGEQFIIFKSNDFYGCFLNLNPDRWKFLNKSKIVSFCLYVRDIKTNAIPLNELMNPSRSLHSSSRHIHRRFWQNVWLLLKYYTKNRFPFTLRTNQNLSNCYELTWRSAGGRHSNFDGKQCVLYIEYSSCDLSYNYGYKWWVELIFLNPFTFNVVSVFLFTLQLYMNTYAPSRLDYPTIIKCWLWTRQGMRYNMLVHYYYNPISYAVFHHA